MGLNESRPSAAGVLLRSLPDQCRAVAAILFRKLVGSAQGEELERSWRRHRGFFGEEGTWFCLGYVAAEMDGYARIVEKRWREEFVEGTMEGSRWAPWMVYGELAEVMLCLAREVGKVEVEGKGDLRRDPEDGDMEDRPRFVGQIVDGQGGVGSIKWYFANESKLDHRAIALDHVLHALALLKENDAVCLTNNENDQPERTSVTLKSEASSSSVRLHYLAGRLHLALNEPRQALTHFKTVVGKIKKWPSIHLAFQRAKLECESRCSSDDENGPSRNYSSKDASIQLLLRPDSCAILSENEISQAQCVAGMPSPVIREVVWRDDEAGLSTPPFEFAVTFLESARATCGETIKACVSIRSFLNVRVFVESIVLNTTAGDFGIPHLQRHVRKEELQTRLTSKMSAEVTRGRNDPDMWGGIRFDSKGLLYFFTEIKIPSSLAETAWGKTAADLTKFYPKNGKLCNMGFTLAAGNICKPRWIDGSKRLTLDGKPVSTSNLTDEYVSFFGGVPLVCHGITLLLKPNSDGKGSSLKLKVDRQNLLSPLGRSDAQQYLMEECNYMAHNWSRPAHHPWSLGPRCLRVFGPRPHMEVTNLSQPILGGDAIEGTVNRVVFKLEAGKDYDCWNVRVRVKCTSRLEVNSSLLDTSLGNELDESEPDHNTLVVQKCNADSGNVTTGGITLPLGWEPSKNVVVDESNFSSTLVSAHIRAGTAILLPLDVFRPIDIVTSDDETEDNTCSTSYTVILSYREVRSAEGANQPGHSGDEVTVVQSGTLNWVKPFSADFIAMERHGKSFPCGVLHASNVMTNVGAPESLNDDYSGIISADGERVRMRLVLTANGLGSHIGANVICVVNEADNNPNQKELYSSSNSSLIMKQAKQGTKLSLSYSVVTQRNTSNANEHVTLPLGVVSVQWEPTSLTLQKESIPLNHIRDEYGLAHGPLSLSDIAPMIFYGPQCQVFNAPFAARLLQPPSPPKVGIPFHVTYQVINKTAKTQSLIYALNDAHSNNDTSIFGASEEYLLVTGKIRGEVQLSPFEEKQFPFTFLSMVAGKVCRPSFSVLCGRNQTWVINDNVNQDRYLFIRP